MKFNVSDTNFVDYQSAMSRFLNDDELYEQAVELFLNSKMLSNIKDGYSNKEYEKIFQSVHELKGACGNLSFTALYEAACVLTECVRNGVDNFSEFENAYKKCVEIYSNTINSLLNKK